MADLVLEDVAEVVVGGTPKTAEPTYWGGGVVWVTPTDITALGQPMLTSSERRITADGVAKSSARIVPEGSVLVTTRATIGATAIAGCELATNQGITALVPREGIDGRWLYYWVEANRREFTSRGVGNTFPEVSRSKSRKIPITVPPLAEQHRIADSVASIDATIDSAATYSRRMRLLGESLRADVFERSDWPRLRVADAMEVTMGRQRAPQHAVGDWLIPYLRAANVKDGRLVLDNVLVMNFTPAEQATFALRPGDVLVTEGCGSLSEIGASAQWRGESDGPVCFQNTLLRLRAREGTTHPEFAYQWARWAYERGAFASVASGTNIFHIGSTRAAAMPVPVPPIGEQELLIAPLTACDATVQSVERCVVALRRLRDGALRAVLSGAHDIGRSYDRFFAAPASLQEAAA